MKEIIKIFTGKFGLNMYDLSNRRCYSMVSLWFFIVYSILNYRVRLLALIYPCKEYVFSGVYCTNLNSNYENCCIYLFAWLFPTHLWNSKRTYFTSSIWGILITRENFHLSNNCTKGWTFMTIVFMTYKSYIARRRRHKAWNVTPLAFLWVIW